MKLLVALLISCLCQFICSHSVIARPESLITPGHHKDQKSIKELVRVQAVADRRFCFFGIDCYRELLGNSSPLGPMSNGNSVNCYHRQQILELMENDQSLRNIVVIEVNFAMDLFNQNQENILDFLKKLGYKRVLIIGKHDWKKGIEIIYDGKL